MFPTKSGVLGLLAAADGRRRTDPIEDLACLRFGVRVDQAGSLLRDFQTAIRWGTHNHEAMPLSYRYYVADAVFVAGVEGEPSLLEALAECLRNPRFPLYLGRRSCPVSGKVLIGLFDDPLEVALRTCPWQAANWFRRKEPQTVELELYLDASEMEDGAIETRRDVPVSYAPERREYGWRDVVHLTPQPLENPDGYPPAPSSGHDWFAAVEEA